MQYTLNLGALSRCFRATGDPSLASEQARKIGASAYSGTTDAQTAEGRNLRAQAGVLRGIQNNVASDAEKGYTYTTLLNGFSMEGKFGEREAILSLPGVKNVYVSKMRFIPAPRLTSAAGLTGVPEVMESFGFWGQVVAVIDTELDTARNAGIFLSVAAGNAAHGYKSSVPLAENTDYAAAGTPNSFSLCDGIRVGG